MNGSTRATLKPSLLLSALLGGIVLTSCAAVDRSSLKNSEATAPMASTAAMDNAQNVSGSEAKRSDVKAPQSRPQLIKRAEISLSVNSIDKSIQAASQVVKQKQGDVFNFEDNKPQDNSTRHTASMEIKVPQEQLETTLDALAKLGTVQRRTLTAEDVTEQLVDNAARLRNLRQQEASLLKIMERSGSVGDVLKVAKELGNVRESIERLDAQLKSLRNQVAYSTIRLSVEEAIAGVPPQRPLGSQAQESWEQATHAVGVFTASLIALSLWLVAFSPYLLVMGGAAFGFNQFKKRRRNTVSQSQPPNAG